MNSASPVCRGKPAADCKPPSCIYRSGAKRRYCARTRRAGAPPSLQLGIDAYLENLVEADAAYENALRRAASPSTIEDLRSEFLEAAHETAQEYKQLLKGVGFRGLRLTRRNRRH